LSHIESDVFTGSTESGARAVRRAAIVALPGFRYTSPLYASLSEAPAVKTAVTGATGHVGSALVRELLARGHSVRALVRKDTRSLEGLPVESVPGDLDSEKSLRRAFEGAEVIFHAAALISLASRGIGSGAGKLDRVNTDGTRRVLEACRACGVRRLVHVSSVEVLDPEPRDEPVDEEHPLVAEGTGDPYGASKAAAEREVRRAAADGQDTVIIYPTGVIGPYDFKPSMMGRAVIAIAKGGFPALVPGGFDWVDVRDVAWLAAEACERAPAGCSRYVAGGAWTTLAVLAAHVCRVTGARPPLLVVPTVLAHAWAPVAAAAARVTGTPALYTSYTLRTISGERRVSHAKATRELGYTPRSLEQTVRDTVAWLTAKGYLDGRG
jgi:dihydroflavonol-4-reductase